MTSYEDLLSSPHFYLIIITKVNEQILVSSSCNKNPHLVLQDLGTQPPTTPRVLAGSLKPYIGSAS